MARLSSRSAVIERESTNNILAGAAYLRELRRGRFSVEDAAQIVVFVKERIGFIAQKCRLGDSDDTHGVRKIAATGAAENGATVAELEAIFGWHRGGMASHYTKEANRVHLAKEAMHKLKNDKRTSNPSPSDEVRVSEPKG